MRTRDRIKELERKVRSLEGRVKELETDCYIHTYYDGGRRGKKISQTRSIGLILDYFGLNIKHYPSLEVLKIVERDAPEQAKEKK